MLCELLSSEQESDPSISSSCQFSLHPPRLGLDARSLLHALRKALTVLASLPTSDSCLVLLIPLRMSLKEEGLSLSQKAFPDS